MAPKENRINRSAAFIQVLSDDFRPGNDALAGENGDDYVDGAAGDEGLNNGPYSVNFLTNKTIFCEARFPT